MDGYDIGHDPTPGGVMPTPTRAADVHSPADTSLAQGRSGEFIVPPGTPFYTAALAAAAAGYASMKYPDPATGAYTVYPTTADALASYARNTGAQSSAAAARALAPVPTPEPHYGIPAQSVPPMGGNAASLIPGAYQTSPWQPNGSGSVWATSLLHTGIAGGVEPAAPLDGGPAGPAQGQDTGAKVGGA